MAAISRCEQGTSPAWDGQPAAARIPAAGPWPGLKIDVARRVGHINAIGQHANSRSAAGKRSAMRRHIDAEGTTGQHRHALINQICSQIRAMPFPYAVAAREPTIATDRSIR